MAKSARPKNPNRGKTNKRKHNKTQQEHMSSMPISSMPTNPTNPADHTDATTTATTTTSLDATPTPKRALSTGMDKNKKLDSMLDQCPEAPNAPKKAIAHVSVFPPEYTPEQLISVLGVYLDDLEKARLNEQRPPVFVAAIREAHMALADKFAHSNNHKRKIEEDESKDSIAKIMKRGKLIRKGRDPKCTKCNANGFDSNGEMCFDCEF